MFLYYFLIIFYFSSLFFISSQWIPLNKKLIYDLPLVNSAVSNMRLHCLSIAKIISFRTFDGASFWVKNAKKLRFLAFERFDKNALTFLHLLSVCLDSAFHVASAFSPFFFPFFFFFFCRILLTFQPWTVTYVLFMGPINSTFYQLFH